jgi:hypothetical protein
MTPADIPTLWELARVQNERDGTDYAPPRIFDDNNSLLFNIPLAVKLERDGRMVQGHVFELMPELLTFGGTALDSRASLRDLGAVLYLLRKSGYETFDAVAPLTRIEQVERLVKRIGMKRDVELARFYRPEPERS